ncbi:hypothetical protein TWF694_011783 [Orbilia ellipsospora]|uniref:Uncharacterized protein n=1 Tax=Orbilia ellipsospora TaxID=2528407 RepID=A0AAV9XCG7_9PEZI
MDEPNVPLTLSNPSTQLLSPVNPNDDKENNPPSVPSPSGRQLRRSIARMPPFVLKAEPGPDENQKGDFKSRQAGALNSNSQDQEGEWDGEHDDDEFPFVGLFHQEASNIRAKVKWDKDSVLTGGLRRRRLGGRVEVLRDATDEVVNTGRVQRGDGWFGKAIADGKNINFSRGRGGFEVYRDEITKSEEENEDGNNAIPSRLGDEDGEEDTEDESHMQPGNEKSGQEQDQIEAESIEPLEPPNDDIENDTDSDSNSEFIRTDNIVLRSKLHPPEVSELRSTHLQDISIHRDWTARKAHLAKNYPDEISLHPSLSPLKPQPYKPPSKKRIGKGHKMAYPARTLFHHLGLLDKSEDENEEENLKNVYRWMRKQDALLMEQVSLVGARLQFPHINYIYTNVFVPLRLLVLEYIRTQYPYSSHCLFFSEFTFFNERWDQSNRGCCLFLMIDTYDITTVKREIERMLSDLHQDDELAVIVRKGNPRLFGSYGLPNSSSNETVGNEQTVKPNTRGTWQAIKKAVSTKNYETSPETNRIRRGRSWTPERTPERRQPFKGLNEITHYDTNWKELQAFHYGLRWTTTIPGIPSLSEGVNGKYQERPDMGASIGAKGYGASGTLAGYLTDPNGEVYSMSCHHVIYFDSERSSFAFKTNSLKGTIAISPSNPDLRAETIARAHEIDGLVHEATRAKIHKNYALAQSILEEGRRKIEEHDKHAEVCAVDGAKYAKVVGSAWRLVYFPDGPWIMDQVLMKPHPDRIGTNTFTYTGRDNKEGKRYRLEARGWTDLNPGDEVLKIGRTTGLTKGHVVSTNADFRLCLGDTGTGTCRYWDIQAGVITSGAGPWFSSSGDSGAWILKTPTFEEMLKWDLRRGGGEKVYDPIAAPVGGMMFAGADSVDGFSLTFYNPSWVLREYLAMMVEGGEELVPGLGAEMEEPPPLDIFLRDACEWGTQSDRAMDGLHYFIEDQYWDHQLDKYPENHMFRNPSRIMNGKGKGGYKPDANPEADRNDNVAGRKGKNKPAVRAMVDKDGFRLTSGYEEPSVRLMKTPQKATSEEAFDTPVRSLAADLESMEFLAESSKTQMKDMRVRSPTPNRMQPNYNPIKQRVRGAVAKIENKRTSNRD